MRNSFDVLFVKKYHGKNSANLMNDKHKTSHLKMMGLAIAFVGLSFIAWGVAVQIENRMLIKNGVVVEALHADLKRFSRGTFRSNRAIWRVFLVYQIEGEEFETSIIAPSTRYWSLFDEPPILLVYDPKKPKRVKFKLLVDEQSISWGLYGVGALFCIFGSLLFFDILRREKRDI